MKKYVAKGVLDDFVIVDEEFERRYVAFKDLSSKLFNDSGPRILIKKVYQWCLDNGFRYRKIAYCAESGSLGYYPYHPTGILFVEESHAMAFKLRWC